MHSVFAEYFSKLRNDKIVHNNYYRPCMINRTILIILLGNCILSRNKEFLFNFKLKTKSKIINLKKLKLCVNLLTIAIG